MMINFLNHMNMKTINFLHCTNFPLRFFFNYHFLNSGIGYLNMPTGKSFFSNR